MKVFPASFSKLYQIVGCINSILNISIDNNSVLIQSGFFDTLDYPVLIRDYQSQKNESKPTKYDFYVSYLGETPFRTFWINLKKYEYFTPSARYIFIDEELEDSFVSDLLDDFVLNFVVLVLKSEEIFTVFPYETGRLDKFSTKLQKIGSCKNGVLSMDQFDSIFPNKIPPVWKRSNLTLLYTYEAPYSMASTGPNKGIEIDLLQLILGRIGMDGDYVDKKNPITHTLFIMTKKGKFDIQFGNIATALNSTREPTVAYSCDSAFWYVPLAQSIPKWKFALVAFSEDVLLTWLACICTLCLLWDVANVLLRKRRLGRSFLNNIWRTTTMLLEQGAKLRIKHVTPKILVFLLLQSFMVLNYLYKAKYTIYLSGANHEKPIESIDEVMGKGLKLGSTKYLIGVYSSTPRVKKYLVNNYVECDTGLACLNRSADEKDLAVLKPYKKVAYVRHSYMDHHGHYKHHRITAPVFTLCNSFIFPKGHPLYSLINRYVSLTVQHGFVQKIMLHYDQMKKKETKLRVKNLKLKFDAVKGPIFILAIGILLGSTIFVVEKTFYRNTRGH